jgi:DNA-binding transcriptional ArsR family regulator
VIRIHLDDATLARTRIAISPLHELVSGLQLLHRHADQAPWPYTDWAARARDVLRTNSVTQPLGLYGLMSEANRSRRTPDLFNPIPESAFASLPDQVRALRRTPVELVRQQFGTHYPDGIPAYLQPYLDEPERAFGRLADGLEAFWEQAVAPYWPGMRRALEEEVLLRARSLAADGPAALLADLRGNARWEPPVLTLVRQRRIESRLDAVDQRLLLVPLILAGNRLTVSTDHPEIVMLSYQARGEAVLAPDPVPAPAAEDRLASLIGPGRAKVLRALRHPATTTGLATGLGLAPSTVSEQLAALQAAGVVHRRRSGRQVFYGLEPAGTALLSLLEPTHHPTIRI